MQIKSISKLQILTNSKEVAIQIGNQEYREKENRSSYKEHSLGEYPIRIKLLLSKKCRSNTGMSQPKDGKSGDHLTGAEGNLFAERWEKEKITRQSSNGTQNDERTDGKCEKNGKKMATGKSKQSKRTADKTEVWSGLVPFGIRVSLPGSPWTTLSVIYSAGVSEELSTVKPQSFTWPDEQQSRLQTQKA